MNPRAGILVSLVLALGFWTPVALGQKPPAPPPTPPPTGPSPPTSAGPSPIPVPGSATNAQPGVLPGDMVKYLLGSVKTSDGSPIPSDAKIERLCNAKIRQQAFIDSRGDFTMDLGDAGDSFMDASVDGGPLPGQGNNMGLGISRHVLMNCELRASISGFKSDTVNLMNLDVFGNSVNVGTIVASRRGKVDGATLSAVPYKAPNDARKLYVKGMDAQKNGKVDAARQYFEKAVAIYPKYASAWYRLGAILQNQKQLDSAQKAFVNAANSDNRFLPPYLSLAALAYEGQRWEDVLQYTGHILENDPLIYSRINSYILDLDSFDYARAYLYNAAANFNLNRMEAAEKSGVRAESLDVRPLYPRLHVLLAEIFARKNNYDRAISELKIYMELAPNAKDLDHVREWIAQLEKLNSAAPASDKNGQM